MSINMTGRSFLLSSARWQALPFFPTGGKRMPLTISGYALRSLGATKASEPTRATPTTALIWAAHGAPMPRRQRRN